MDLCEVGGDTFGEPRCVLLRVYLVLKGHFLDDLERMLVGDPHASIL